MDHALNWLWQGCVVAAATFVALHCLGRSRAQARYAVCSAALLSVIALPLLALAAGALSSLPSPVAGSEAALAPIEPALVVPAAWWTSTTVMLTLWALWAGAYCVRLGLALHALRRAIAHCRPFPAVTAARLTHWQRLSAQGRRTRLVLSNAVGSAAVLGCGAPIIAVSPRLLSRLTTEELDRVVVHEWSHVQRRDDVINLIHLGLRAAAGWHPAVWWLERQMRIEREAACDETAVTVTGCPKQYALALAVLASLRTRDRRALPAVGAVSSPALGSRVVRILSHRRLISRRWSAGGAAVAVLALVVLSTAVAAFTVVEIASHAPAAAKPTMVAAASIDPAIAALPAATARMPRAGHAPAVRPFADHARRPPEQPAPRVGAEAAEPSTAGAGPLKSTSSSGGEVAIVAAAPSVSEPRAEAAASARLITAPLELIERPPLSGDVAASVSRPLTPWRAAADAGLAIGRGSEKAAVATAGLFTRFGKKVAASF